MRVLGPFEATLGGQPIVIGSVKQRAVFALLALQAGKVVSADALCDVIWDDPPANPTKALQVLV